MFSETYRTMQEDINPSLELIEDTVAQTHQRMRLRRPAVIAAVLALSLCIATPVAAATVEPVYELLYLISPATAQFFQPVRKTCVDNGVTMEVISVCVEGDKAQAYISLSGETVDETCDLFDSYRFHLPFDQIGHCERVSFDPNTNTATFLCTVETMDGSPIPIGGKMTFSVNCFLNGKVKENGMTVDISLPDYAMEGKMHSIYNNGGSYDPDVYAGYPDDYMNALVPQDPIITPAENISITGMGYVDGLFHVQMAITNKLELDPHAWLYLVDQAGNRIERYYTFGTIEGMENGEDTGNRIDYEEFVFDVSPDELANYTLQGDFYTATQLIEGDWRITFPLENSL